MALINISDAFFNLMRCKIYFLVLYVYVGVGRSSERLESAKKVLARDADKDHRGEQGPGHQEVGRTRVQLSPGGNKKVPWHGDCGRSSANLLFLPLGWCVQPKSKRIPSWNCERIRARVELGEAENKIWQCNDLRHFSVCKSQHRRRKKVMCYKKWTGGDERPSALAAGVRAGRTVGGNGEQRNEETAGIIIVWSSSSSRSSSSSSSSSSIISMNLRRQLGPSKFEVITLRLDQH